MCLLSRAISPNTRYSLTRKSQVKEYFLCSRNIAVDTIVSRQKRSAHTDHSDDRRSIRPDIFLIFIIRLSKHGRTENRIHRQIRKNPVSSKNPGKHGRNRRA